MKFAIKHLLHYRWEGPSIGIRCILNGPPFEKKGVAVIIPIPQWFSDFLKFLTRNTKPYPGEFSI